MKIEAFNRVAADSARDSRDALRLATNPMVEMQQQAERDLTGAFIVPDRAAPITSRTTVSTQRTHKPLSEAAWDDPRFVNPRSGTSNRPAGASAPPASGATGIAQAQSSGFPPPAFQQAPGLARPRPPPLPAAAPPTGLGVAAVLQQAPGLAHPRAPAALAPTAGVFAQAPGLARPRPPPPRPAAGTPQRPRPPTVMPPIAPAGLPPASTAKSTTVHRKAKERRSKVQPGPAS